MPSRVRNWALFIAALVVLSALAIAFRPIVLGLDLQGGIQLVLEINDEDIVAHELKINHNNIVDRLKQQKKPLPKTADSLSDTLVLHFESEDQAQQAYPELRSYFETFSKLDREGADVSVKLQRLYLNQLKQRVLKQTMETLSRRINESGITEPVIHRQGYDKIVVQLAGVTTSLDLKDVIERTAVLKFKLVEKTAADKELLLEPPPAHAPEGEEPSEADRVPEGFEIYPQMDEEGTRAIAWYLVQEVPEIDGTLLEQAVTTNDQRGLPAVSFTFNAEGAEQFGNLTRENLQRQLAIVLDDKVQSAPVIQSEIRRNGQITGSFTLAEAQTLAIVLRSGPLPVKVQVSEEHLVGPSLGHDSIRQGLISMIVGSVLVLIFMMVYYRKGGSFAVVALVLNILFIVAFLATFGAVLTLPGIAGLVLTVGMAVDSNVLIFERMREELDSGKSVRASIDAGYAKATTTILDANVTTLITGIVLFLFGTGPIKGFAVILTVGILSSVFTSVIVTRLFYDYMTSRRRMHTLSI